MAFMSMKRAIFAVAALAVMGATPQDALTRARQLYNQQQYDAAIVAASEARQRPGFADAAALVLARAHLERYRGASDAADLAAARTSLVAIDASRLQPRDRFDLLIGLGELLYFEGHFGAAGEMFGAALGPAASAGAVNREYILDWWAAALDREAQASGDAERRRIYARLLERVEPAAAGDQPSAAALYWVAAAAAGMDDFGRAWHAAIAAWIRAPLAAGPQSSLRADLERLVRQVIIPGRAATSAPASDPMRAAAAMQSEWEAIKELGLRR
jgi:hypothetical protein